MDFQGLTVDVPVTDLNAARPFYEWVMDRPPDLAPTAGTLEWILNDRPQIALRVVCDPALAGSGRVGVGVSDVHECREMLAAGRPLADVKVVPGVIAILEIADDDGNQFTYWQDLLGTGG